MRSIARYAAWGVVVAVSAVALVACGGGATGPTVIDVDGRVVGAFGEGLSDLFVAIDGHAPATTDAEGGFAFQEVTPPYDLVVYAPAEGWAHLFAGLTTATPEAFPLAAADGGPPPDAEAGTVVGDLSEVVAAGRIAVVCAESDERTVGSCTSVEAGASDYELQVLWAGPASVNVTVRAILYEIDGNQTSTAVASMGSADVEVASGAIEGPVDVVLDSVDEGTIDFTVVVPEGWTLDALMASTRVAERDAMSFVPVGSPATASFTLAYASFGGADHGILAKAEAGDADAWAWKVGLDAGGQEEILEFATPAAKVRPVDGAVDVAPGAELELVPRPGSGFLHTLEPSVPGAGPELTISTVEPTAALPDLEHLDPALALPAAEVYEWRVGTLSGVAGPDELVADGGLLGPFVAIEYGYDVFYGTGPEPSATLAVGANSAFTLQ